MDEHDRIAEKMAALNVESIGVQDVSAGRMRIHYPGTADDKLDLRIGQAMGKLRYSLYHSIPGTKSRARKLYFEKEKT